MAKKSSERVSSRRKKIKRIIIWLSVAIFGAALLAVLAFFILIVWGASPRLQELWVCSAMKTYEHQYLATAFISETKIEEILRRTHNDDTGYDTEIDDIVIANGENKNSGSETAVPPEKVTSDEPEREDVPDSVTPPSEENTDIPEPVITDKYEDEGYTKLEEGLYLKKASGQSWEGWLMLISDPTRVKLEDTQNQFVCGQKVARMIKNAGAIAGINGGGFTDGPNYDSNGGTPSGLVIADGKLVNPQSEYEINNKNYNMIGLNSDGVLVLRHCTARWALDNDIVSAVSFSPFLIVNGEGIIKNGTGGWGIAPRTALGQRKTGEIIFFVIDGRQIHSIGADLLPLQETLLAEGCHNAAMMDGGSSTVMLYGEEFVNKPSLGFERYINNCWVVLPAKQAAE